jgi:hypothetical protein
VIAALLALAGALAAQAHLPLLLRAPLGYLLLGVIPGWVLADGLLRSPGTTPEERAMASLTLSIPLAIAGRALAFALGFPAPTFLWGWAGLCAAGCLLVRRRPADGPPADPTAWLVAAALALLVGLPAAINPVVRVIGDGMLHAQIVSEIRLRGIPPQNPSYAGLPMNYMWLLHVWVAALVEAMGLSAYRVFPWVGGAMMGALALGVFRIASLFWSEPLHRRLAPAVVALGMNSLGWVPMLAYLLVAPAVGVDRGFAEFQSRASDWLLHPNAHFICYAMIQNSYFVLCSFLFKFMCANAIGTSLALIVATVTLVAVSLCEGGRGRLAAIVVLAMTAAAIHPVLGVPAGLAVIAGLGLAALSAEGRTRAPAPALAVAGGLALAVPVMWSMLHSGLEHGTHARIRVVTQNLAPLAQGLGVVLLPAAWGWAAARRRSPTLARFGLGFALASLAVAVVFETPVPKTMAYTVYTAYLGVALFAGAGVGMLAGAVARRLGGAPAWMLIVLLFLPNALLLSNGFARQSAAWGLGGYPETPDEIALFDYVRDHTPREAVVVDLQPTGSSSVAAYSERRGFFGGGPREEASVLGYPPDTLAMRWRAVVNLLLEPGLSDSTIRVLRSVPAPLYVVARRTPPRERFADPPPGRAVDAVAKLDSLPEDFARVTRTPTLALYRLAR